MEIVFSIIAGLIYDEVFVSEKMKLEFVQAERCRSSVLEHLN